VDLVLPQDRLHLTGGRRLSPKLTVPWTAVGADKTGPSGLPNRIDRYSCFEQEISAPYLDHAQTHFGDSSWESTTSTMKKGGPDTNGSDLNKDNIIKPTFDKLME
jgi:hypothetical protein